VVLQVYRIHYKEEAGTPSKLLEKNWKTGIITHPFPPFLHAYLPVHRVYVAIIMVEEVSVEGLGDLTREDSYPLLGMTSWI
jgi:hypothetical protein